MTDGVTKVVRTFAVHFAIVGWMDRTPGERGSSNSGQGVPLHLSGFVIAIGERWFLVTAGHVLDDIDRAETNGQLFTNWHVEDQFGIDAASEDPIPFDYHRAMKARIVDAALGLDYGCIGLGLMYQRLMEKNGIVPLSKETWASSLAEEFDHYFLLGIPAHLTETLDDAESVTVSRSVVLHQLDRLPDNYPGFKATLPLFHGRLADSVSPVDGTPLTDLRGASGGPIFGVRRDSEGAYRYKLVAIQSGWLPSERVVEACPIAPFAELIERECRRADEEGSESGDDA